MSRVVPTREQGHLIVAGIRVLRHRQDRPPRLEDVAELIEMPAEQARVLVSELEDLGILRRLTTAFDVRLSVDDHLALEQLPEEKDVTGLDTEVRQFKKAFNEKQQELKKTFGADALRKKDESRMSKMADELKKFRGRTGAGGTKADAAGKTYPYEDDE